MKTRKYYLQEIGTGAFTFLLYDQCNSVGSLVRSITTLWVLCFTSIAYGLIMFIAAPLASLVATVFGILLVSSLNWLMRKSKFLSQKIAEQGEDYSQSLAEKYRVSNLVRLSNSLPREQQDVENRTQKLLGWNIKLAETAAKLQLITVPLMIGMSLLVLYFCVEYLDLTAIAMMVFFVAIVRLMPLVQGFAAIRQNINAIGAYVERIESRPAFKKAIETQ